MRMTEDARFRCSSLLKDFAKRKGLCVTIDHEIGEKQTKILFETPDHHAGKNYWMLWDEMNNVSEGCAYIFADVINAWNLDKKITCSSDYVIAGVIDRESEDTRFEIKNVIFNDPATIVLWEDDTKTVVKCQEGDIYSRETGLALCIAKKALGNKGNFNEVFKKWIPEEEFTTTATDTPTINIQYNSLFDQNVLDKFCEDVDKAIRDKLNRFRGGCV